MKIFIINATILPCFKPEYRDNSVLACNIECWDQGNVRLKSGLALSLSASCRDTALVSEISKYFEAL